LWHFNPNVWGQGRFKDKVRLGGGPETWLSMESIKAIHPDVQLWVLGL